MNKKNILIVDDQELNREILTVILSKNYHILEASNGKEALDILMTMGKAISLILLDIVMPVMDGIEFMEHIQTEPDLHEIPIIFVTTETYMENILTGVRMGVRDVIAKPYDAYLVRERVDNLIQLTAGRSGSGDTAYLHPQRHPTVLIVEDVDINREILKNALKDTYNILEARDGQSGLRQIEANKDKIDAVLLDIMMPVMDGIEMMREVIRRRLLTGKPVIAVTAENSPARLEEMKSQGICEIINKPYNPDIIKNRIKNMIELYRRNPVNRH